MSMSHLLTTSYLVSPPGSANDLAKSLDQSSKMRRTAARGGPWRGRILLYALLYPILVAVFHSLGASALLNVWSLWILAGFALTLMSANFFEWGQISELIEGPLVTSVFLIGAPMGFATVLTSSELEIYAPGLALLPTLLYGSLLMKAAGPSRRSLASWSWVGFSIAAALLSSMVFSYTIATVVILSSGCLAGWFHDSVSSWIPRRYGRLFLWLGLYMAASLAVYAAVQGSGMNLHGRELGLFFVGAAVSMHSKTSYLLSGGRTGRDTAQG